MRSVAALLPLVLLAAPSTPPAPRDGADLVRQMHARYEGSWYRTLTFTQTTTFPGEPAQTWYEAASIPGRLRIDIAPLDSMTAILFIGDSTIVFKHGARVNARRDRNLLMTLGFDVYRQPVDTTAAQLAAAGIDLGKVHEDRWHGTKVWVVGADRGDTTSSQFWIEQDRLLFVRLIEAHAAKQAGAPADLLDITFENYQRLARAWVAPKVVIKLNGQEVQREEYRDIEADRPLPADLYDTGTYRPAAWIVTP
ncbi:MAG TPA: hypothetical protein VJQ46_03860 [Gemmatimonadales bacterium]|nr:hypothetical protein [Gemmatimonadales bacterium]